jgi:glycine dehydrogenase subunit 1
MRYLPLTTRERGAMLAEIGVDSIDALFSDVPHTARFEGQFDLTDHMSEMAVSAAFRKYSAGNIGAETAPCFLGGGAYRHHVPASVDHLIQRGEFLTAYTPYQPEISQGTLQTLFEFQTQVALVTGMDVANASMYDGATACAEAILMARRITKRAKAVLSPSLHPHYRDVAITTCRHLGTEFIERDPAGGATEGDQTFIETNLADLARRIDDQTACVVVQSPDVFGAVHELSGLSAACHEAGALMVVVVTEPVSFGALIPPGEMGADIVVAEGQGIGNGLNFGGPYLGLFATRDAYVRQMPGRLCGQAHDADGRQGYTLTLSAREQHIRREKATSNICTNSGLTALAFSIHLSLLGEVGFRQLALINHARALATATKLAAIPDVEILTDAYFNEFAVQVPGDASEIVEALAARGILGGVPVSRLFPGRAGLTDLILVTATETVTAEDIDTFANGLGAVL